MAQSDKRIYEFGPFRLEPRKRRLLKYGETLALPAKALDILLALVENRGQVVEKEELMRRVWADSFVEEANLTVNMSALRKALGETKTERPYIATVSGRGYRFIADVAELEEPGEASTAEDQENYLPPPAELIESQRRESSATASGVIATKPDSNHISVSARQEALPDRSQHRRALVAVTLVLLVVGIGALVYYLVASRKASEGNSTKPSAETSTPQSIAILPFQSLNAAAEDEYLGLAMADALITRLSTTGRLIVRPTSAVRKYAGLAQNIAQVGKELGVDAVLDGSIQRVGNHLRVTARLVDVKSGSPIWAEKFDEEVKDIFTVQDRVSEQAAQALTLKLTADERRRLTRHSTESAEAYHAYAKGRFFWDKRTQEGYTKAIEHFEQALVIDPRFALAYSGLADCYFFRGEQLPPREAMPKAKRAALKALEIDSTLAEAHASLAKVKQYFDWDWAGAEESFQTAIRLDPNYPTAHHWYAQFLMNLGRADEAMREINRARELSPLSLIINTDVAGILQDMRRYDEAIAVYRQAIEMDANFARAHFDLGRALTQKGLYDEAAAEIQKAITLSAATPRLLAALGYVYAVAGKTAKAKEVLNDLQRAAKQRYVPGYNLALIHAGLGNKDEALKLLEQSYEERFAGMAYLKIEPRFDSLRSDRRFVVLIQRLGFTD